MNTSLSRGPLDLGHGHTLRFLRWAPDDLPENRARFGVPLPVVERSGAVVEHPHLKLVGETCISAIHFNDARFLEHNPGYVGRVWEVVTWEPLTLSPSLLCRECGDHGFIREGRWVPA
jgi:hypothetical protein